MKGKARGASSKAINAQAKESKNWEQEFYSSISTITIINGRSSHEDSPGPSAHPSGNDSPGPQLTRITLSPRSVSVPTPKESRRLTKKGKTGCQKSARELFNAAVANKGNFKFQSEFPISKSTCSNILDRVRDTLCSSSLQVPRGHFTCTELKKKGVVLLSRRALEKYFPILQCAEKQWAADRFIQEAVQTDRKEKKRQEKAARLSGSGHHDERQHQDVIVELHDTGETDGIASKEGNADVTVQDLEEEEMFSAGSQCPEDPEGKRKNDGESKRSNEKDKEELTGGILKNRKASRRGKGRLGGCYKFAE